MSLIGYNRKWYKIVEITQWSPGFGDQKAANEELVDIF